MNPAAPPSAPLLVVWHSRTGACRALAEAAVQGAGGRARLLPAADCGPDDLRGAAGLLFVAPENLGALSGTMKELFDRCYYPLLGAIEGRPYAAIIAAGSDGQGACRQLERIVTGWRLRRVAEPLVVRVAAADQAAILAPKSLDGESRAAAAALGATLAEGLALGIF